MANNIVGDLTKVSVQWVTTECTAVSTAFTDIGCLKSVTPPGSEREVVDASCLGDTDATNQVGGKLPQEFTFTAAWDPSTVTTSEHYYLDVMYDNKCTAAWKISNSQWSATQGTFTGRIIALAPNAVDRGSIITREVRVALSSDITFS